MIRRDVLRALPLIFIPRPGLAQAKLARFDELMHAILRDQRLPGGSLSLAKDGRLVYARGFGLASVEGHVTVRPATMFGLASVSKSITAVGILKLVDQGRLKLDDRAFEFLRDIKPMPGQHPDPRTREITIRQLLNHSGGVHPAAGRGGTPQTIGRPQGEGPRG